MLNGQIAHTGVADIVVFTKLKLKLIWRIFIRHVRYLLFG